MAGIWVLMNPLRYSDGDQYSVPFCVVKDSLEVQTRKVYPRRTGMTIYFYTGTQFFGSIRHLQCMLMNRQLHCGEQTCSDGGLPYHKENTILTKT